MYDTQFTAPLIKRSQDACAGRLSANGRVVRAGDTVALCFPFEGQTAQVLRVQMTGLGYDVAVLDRSCPLTGAKNWTVNVAKLEVL